jgi:Predicted membrane protein
MFRLIVGISAQSLLFLAAQLLLKISVKQFGAFSWTWLFFKKALLNPYLMLSGLCAVFGTVLWMVILKKYDFGLVYPLTSLSYVFGLFAAQWILHEQIPVTRWVGVAIIAIGVFFVAKP